MGTGLGWGWGFSSCWELQLEGLSWESSNTDQGLGKIHDFCPCPFTFFCFILEAPGTWEGGWNDWSQGNSRSWENKPKHKLRPRCWGRGGPF